MNMKLEDQKIDSEKKESESKELNWEKLYYRHYASKGDVIILDDDEPD
jgi:hypothetical protein